LTADKVNPAKVFIDHALGLEWSALPARTQIAAKAFLYDTICVGVAGAKAPYAEALGEVVKNWGTGTAGSVLGRLGWRLPPPSAAFLNAFQIHSQEYDCVHEQAVAHPLATVAAVLMVEAERSGPYRGADVLAALVAGVDVVAGLGVAAPTPLKFFRPATAGIFGCVAALARLKRLPRETALDAFGYALAFFSGTMQAHVEGKPALPVQVANAARGAVAALDIAEAGMPGPRHGLDGPFGYLTLTETTFDLAPVLASLGQIYRIDEVSWKPFPTGRAAQGGIVAIQTLMREHGLKADNLESLTYSAPPLIKRLVGRQAIEAMGPAHARLCLPWLAAVVLTKGAVGLDDFTPASLADPNLLALSTRVTVEDDGNPDPATFVPAEAVARFRDGREARVAVAQQFGSPLWPLSRPQQLEKGAACLAFAGLSERHEALIAAFDAFETLEDAATAFRLAC
jgi:2-methylcitrate dehydratase PrpD